MNRKVDAIIIGAGVIGACVAYELAKKGWKTLSIDKLPEAGHGSTSGSCAIIRTYYSAFETCAIAYEGWHYWKNWGDYLGLAGDPSLVQYHDTGCLVIKDDHNKNLEQVCATMEAIGCPYQHVDTKDISAKFTGADTRRFYPAKTIHDEAFGEATGDALNGAVFFPCGGYVSDPKLSAQNAQKAAMAKGAEFLFRAEITEIRKENGRVAGVTLKDGTAVDAPVVINVGGPHSSILNEMAGVRAGMKMSTRALRHEVAHVPAPASIDYGKGGFVYSDSDIATYARSEVGNHILIGSEDPPCDEKEWVDDPDNYNTEFTDQNRTLVMRLAQRLPALGIPEQAKGVVALYDVTEDWIPIYDKSDLPGFYMACGTSGNQFKNAPVAGKMMAAIIEACENGQDHDVEPVQFHLENIDKTISLGTFSRNRDINPNSSFSVIG
ncbi:MAG: FAD-dependent oxidoreductase [Pseudomonadota bacterium]